MAQNINMVAISGNLTREPELRRTQSGMAILSFGVAVNDRSKNGQTGEWEDYANFLDCIVFGKRAESLENILAKGMKVFVNGKLHWSQWERDGQKRSKVEIIADTIDLPAKNTQQGYQQPQQGYQQPQPMQQPQQQYGAPMQAQQPPQQYAPPQQYNQPQQQAYQQPQQSYQQQANIYDEDIPF